MGGTARRCSRPYGYFGTGQLKPYKSLAKSDNEYGYLPKLATELNLYLINSLMDGTITPETLFDEEELELYD